MIFLSASMKSERVNGRSPFSRSVPSPFESRSSTWAVYVKLLSVLVKIVSPSHLNEGSLEAAVTFDLSYQQERFDLDLRQLRFASLFALVQLLTIMSLARENDADVSVWLPTYQKEREHLARVGFYDAFPDGVEVDQPVPHLAAPRQVLPLTRLNVREGSHSITELSDLSYAYLPKRSREGFIEALAETVQNVLDHSGANIGFVVGHRNADQLDLVVGDAGIGFKASLAEGDPNIEKMNDADAIVHALDEGVTSKPGQNTGIGLTVVREYAEEFYGDLMIRSGKGLVIIGTAWHPERRQVYGLSGTIVAVTLRKDWW